MPADDAWEVQDLNGPEDAAPQDMDEEADSQRDARSAAEDVNGWKLQVLGQNVDIPVELDAGDSVARIEFGEETLTAGVDSKTISSR